MTPVYKLSASSAKNGRTAYTSMLAGNATYVEASDFYSIATTTVGSGGTSTVSFTSIPADYTHLQLRYIGKNSRNSSWAGFLTLQINSAYGARYHYFVGNGADAFSGGGVPGAGEGYQLLAPGLVTSTFGGGVVDILDYKDTNKTKTIRILSGTDVNGSGGIALTSYLVNSTSAISSITIGGVDSGTIQEYSHFALYGTKVAV